MEILWLVVEERGYAMYDVVEFADNMKLCFLKESIILFLFQLMMVINWWMIEDIENFKNLIQIQIKFDFKNFIISFLLFEIIFEHHFI